MTDLSRGYGDVVRANPKPTGAGRWKKSLKAARSYADSWGRELVKRKWSRCVTCGSDANLTWAHVLSGGAQAIKWDVYNMTRQCVRCNVDHENNTEPLYSWCKRTYGEAQFNALMLRGYGTAKLTYSQIMKKGDELRKLCKEIAP